MGADRTLLVVAAVKEAEAVLRGASCSAAAVIEWSAREIADHLDLVVTGVGKANAAAGTARALDPLGHGRVISLGVSGALPGSGLKVGDIVEADRCVLADEGSANPDRFLSIAEMGFGPLADLCGRGNGMDGMSIAAAPPCWRDAGSARALIARRGGLATVSTCSGNDALAAEIARRTGGVAEDMESAAVGFTVARLAPGARFSAVRVISNSTGDRLEQTWDLGLALERLGAVASWL